MVEGYMQAMMALISPSSWFFNNSFVKNAAWINLWDLRALDRKVDVTFKGRLSKALNEMSWAEELENYWEYLLILHHSAGCLGKREHLRDWFCQLELVGAEGKLCALTRGFCHSFFVKPWRESLGPDRRARKWLSSFCLSACPQTELSKLQDRKINTHKQVTF